VVTTDPEATPLLRRNVDLDARPVTCDRRRTRPRSASPFSRGYRMTIGGIGDKAQLHTLLAVALIGAPADGMIPGAAHHHSEITREAIRRLLEVA